MNYLLAKVKRRPVLLKILSNEENIYAIPEGLENSINYNPSTLLEDEWYKIENFSTTTYCIDFLNDDFVTVNYNQIAKADFLKIDYLCAVQGQKYFFQNMTTNLIIRKNWFSIANTPTLVKDQPIIIINNSPDAIYDKEIDRIYFRKLSSIKNIFNGIDSLYREATTQETQAFLNHDFINLVGGFSVNSVKIPNRKRIALVIDTLNNYTPEEKSNVCNYIQDYCQTIPFNNGAFNIETEEDLKHVIYGIEQRFYTTQFSNERRIANSVITIQPIANN